MNNEVLKNILNVCVSDELHKNKVDEILEITMKALGMDKDTPSSNELLKVGKQLIKKQKLSISKLKINKDGNFEFLVYYSAGCGGDWWDKEVLSPFMFHEKVIKPNLV